MKKARKLSQQLLALGTGFTLLLAGTTLAWSEENRDDLVKRQKQAETDKQRAEAALEGVNQELAQVVLNLQQTQNAEKEAQEALAQAQQVLENQKANQAQIGADLKIASAKLEQVREEISEAESHSEETKTDLGEVARALYVGKGNTGAFELWMQDRSVAEFGRYVRNASLAAQIQQQKLQKVQEKLVKARNLEAERKELTEQVRKLKAEADQAVAEAASAEQKRSQSLGELQENLKRQEELRTELDKQKATLEADRAQADKMQQETAAQIAKIDAEARAKAAGSSGVVEGGFNGGNVFQAPIQGPLYVTSPFGYRIHPLLNTPLTHLGTDIAAGCGVPQYAAADGKVFFVGWETAGGNTVKISHGVIGGSTWNTIYRHMVQFATYNGKQVRKGELIGYTGQTGWATGCHVHMELWKNGTPINVMPYIQ